MNYICGIDPACKYTAFSICEWESMKPYKFGRMENQEALTAMLDTIHSLIEDGHTVEVAIEGFQSYGNEFGSTSIYTCYWIGYLQRAFEEEKIPCSLLLRTEERSFICHSGRAGDKEIIAALCEIFAPTAKNHGKGTKDDPGFFYGYKKDIWQSFAVAYTYKLKMEEQRYRHEVSY